MPMLSARFGTMRVWVRWLFGSWLLCLSAQGLTQPAPVQISAKAYWLAIDGIPVWSEQAQARLPPASLTKMMTALLVLERYATQPSMQVPIEVSEAAARETGSRIALRAGEQLTVSDLLAAVLIASANDACRALVDHIAGNQKRFVHQMNQKAKEIGMHGTVFVNACGHDAPQHYSTARDLGVLAQSLIGHPKALELSGKTAMQISTTNGARSFQLKNTNALIGRYPGALGLKTGHTPQAGNCLVAVAQRGNRQVLLVLLKGSNRWWDAVDILDRAFEHASRRS